MKISMMTNDQAAETLIRIAEPISNICDDEELVAMLGEFSKMGELGFIRAVGKMIPKIIPYAMKKHKDDLYEIIGALNSMPTSEVSQMNFAETVKIVKDSYDDILKDFFTRSAIAEKKTENV